MSKVPVEAYSGIFASTTDPNTWSDFRSAHNRAKRPETPSEGVGFVFTDSDPIVGIDLDDCRDPETGASQEWVTDIIDRLDSFTEVSPSGTGYHILVAGELPDGRNRRGDVELYETARFFTITGNHVEGTPQTIEPRTNELEVVHRKYVHQDDQDSEPDMADKYPEETVAKENPTRPASLPDRELLERAENAANGEKFQQLWRGNTAGYESHSEADMALCALLAFWSGGDRAQIDRLFRKSGLMREKWDDQHYANGGTYGKKTIERAIAGTEEFYDPQGGSESPWEDTAPNTTTDEPERSAECETGTEPEDNVTERTIRDPVRRREMARLERIEELESELRTALDMIERLEAELKVERNRRQELKSQLDVKSDPNRRTSTSGTGSSWFPWR